MTLELSLQFPDPEHVVVSLKEDDGETSQADPQAFVSPITVEAQQDLKWYFETYSIHYTTEVDDIRAGAIAAQLPTWGAALFEAVFRDREAERLFNRFQDCDEKGRLITISSSHPAVLAQPWELLRDPKGTHLFLEEPRVSVRRRLTGVGGGRKPFQAKAKKQLHLLFVVSRPKNAGFIDPRSDPIAVMDAIDARAPGRVTVEFLRPATLSGLIDRLDDEERPAVDILHFDGHGAYDPDGRMAAAGKQSILAAGVNGQLRRDAEAAIGPHQGYLLFQEEDGSPAFISAEMLGNLLHRKKVGLVVLSACQSAMVGGEDPMGSVAARLTHAGLPSILAMTHSVLVDTTRALFGSFYENLARGRAIGTALDNARRHLYSHPERGERQRASRRIPLKLQDWFLPALYQVGKDTPLLTKGAAAPVVTEGWGNIRPLQESGFHGRRRELWEIERWFVGGTRRLIVHGFGGQGKTILVEEAGRWLHRTGMFERVCFVSFATFQGVDPVGFTVSNLATVLGMSLIDPAAATVALSATSTLLILDNLERLEPTALNALLGAAVEWSEAGDSRVLITTRERNLRHPDYPTADSNRCRYLGLEGLREEDALDWFQALMKLPPEPSVPLPKREALRELFATVEFHPLSIGVLARELKVRRIAEVGERLEALLQKEDDALVASLSLSIERLDPESRDRLPRLGVFRGGAFEPVVPAVTGLTNEKWQPLRDGLLQTGLIQAEPVPGCPEPFLRFHPTLAPALWARLSEEEREELARGYRAAYYQFANQLYKMDSQAVQVTRAMAKRELPNLLAAVDAALDVGEPWAAHFVDSIDRFLASFSLSRDRERLARRAQAAAGELGSEAWYLARSTLGAQLFGAGRFTEAQGVLFEILTALGETPSTRRGNTLLWLARCQESQGQQRRAEATLREALEETKKLEQTHDVRSLTAALHADLGDNLMVRGDTIGARAAHEASLAIDRELDNDRGIAVSLTQLGAIALHEGDLRSAETSYREALETFRRIGESDSEATIWHQLGIILQKRGRLTEAETALRESARIADEHGNHAHAARSWNHLAQGMEQQGNLGDAEAWYKKALLAHRTGGDQVGEARTLNNLANLLSTQSMRLAEARAIAEDALAIKQTLDHAAAEIWTTYGILAKIAEGQGDTDAAATYRRQERESFAAAPVYQTKLRTHAPLIKAVVAVAADPAARSQIEEVLDQMVEQGWANLVAALRRILGGQRDPAALCSGLDREDTLIVETIMRALDHPAVLDDLAEPSAAPEDGGQAADDAAAMDAVRQLLEKHAPLIKAVVAVAADPTARPQIEPTLDQMSDHGWANLVAALRRILDDGERDPAALCADLDLEDTIVLGMILAGIEDPKSLQPLGLIAASSSAQ